MTAEFGCCPYVRSSHAGAVRRRLPSRSLAAGRLLVERGAVPTNLHNRHLLVLLVEPFAVIGELALPHRVAAAQGQFEEPVGIGERLARRGDDVARAVGEHPLGHGETMDAARADDRRVASGGAHRRADRRGGRDVASERALLVGEMLRHALIAAGPGIGIGRVADPRLLGVVEFSAARGRQEIHAGPRECGGEISGVRDAAAARDAVVGEKAAADDVIAADAPPHRGEHFERQADAVLARPAIAVRAHVRGREEGRHGVGMRLMQLDAVEPRRARAPRRIGEESRQHLRQTRRYARARYR